MAVSKHAYDLMQDRLLFLEALEDTGVDNWSGYSRAWQTFKEWKKEERE